MDLIWNVAMFVLGIGLLVKGSDWLVDASVRMAKQFGVSNFIIGLTIVAFGTSLPELGTEITASFFGNSELILGDIIGSNVANLALVLGLAGLFVPIVVKKDIYLRDGAVMLFATLLFYFFSLDGIITSIEGGIFLFLFFTYIHHLVATKVPFKRDLKFRTYLSEYSDVKKKDIFEEVPAIRKNVKKALHDHLIERIVFALRHFTNFLKKADVYVEKGLKKLARKKVALKFFGKQLLMFFVGVVCVFFGANFVVTNAMAFPFSQLSIGLVIVAIGTSLPELSVTISSLRKGLPEIMIGNLIGSNIANILWVGGIAAIISPIIVPVSEIALDFILLILITWMFLVFLRNDYKITSIESLTMLILYMLFVAIAFGLRLGI